MIKHSRMMLRPKFNPPVSLQEILETCSTHTTDELSRKLVESGWNRIDGWLCFTNPAENNVVKLSTDDADAMFSDFAQNHPDAHDNRNIVHINDQRQTQDGVIITMEELERLEYGSSEADLFEEIYELYMGIRSRDRTSTTIPEDELIERVQTLKDNHGNIFDTIKAAQQYLLQHITHGKEAQQGIYGISNRLDLQRGNTMVRTTGDQKEFVFIDLFKDRYMKSSTPEILSSMDEQTLRLFEIDPEHIRRNPDPSVLNAAQNQFTAPAQE